MTQHFIGPNTLSKQIHHVLFGNLKKHQPTLWVLLGICPIKKAPAPPPDKVSQSVAGYTDE